MNLGSVPPWYMEEVWGRDDLNYWWLMRPYDAEGRRHANIRVGDLFTLGKKNQFGIVTSCILVAGANVEEEFKYNIAGDLGGHWVAPNHSWFRGDQAGSSPGYVRFIPNATQLMELASVIRDDWFGIMAAKLMNHYRRNPFARTHRGEVKT